MPPPSRREALLARSLGLENYRLRVLFVKDRRGSEVDRAVARPPVPTVVTFARPKKLSSACGVRYEMLERNSKQNLI